MILKRITIEVKDIDGMVAALKKAAKDAKFDFKGDKKSGSVRGEGFTIEYVVKDHTVDVTLQVDWDINSLEKTARKLIKPYE